jgi:cytochrome d ubiquinol oxidase subunit I
MTDLLAARLQMALSLGFHIIFAVIGIGMPLLMCIAEYRWLRTGRESSRQLARRWAKGTAIFFAVGAVSGTVLSFELGLLWPTFMKHAGGIIGFPFSLEGFAFFTEAIFLGVYLYGWDRINRWVHLAAGVIVALSGAASAVFVVMANAWMNTPAGFDYDPATQTFSNIDPIAAMFNTAALHQVIHMLGAAYAATAFGAAGIHALQLLRAPGSVFHREALAICMAVALPAAVLQPLTGHYAAGVVAVAQPAKLAAMEGQFKTERGAPLRIGGIPDESAGTTRYAIEIPGMLSFLAFNDFNAEVTGLEDIPRENWPPVAITHLAFQTMVACGMAMMAAALWFTIAAWRSRRDRKRWIGWKDPDAPGGLASWVRGGGWDIPQNRWLLRALVLCAPLGFIAIEAGWTTTEVGRQPWIIYNVLRTADAVTPMPNLLVPMITFTLVYLGLGAIVVALIVSQVRAAPTAASLASPRSEPPADAPRDTPRDAH